MSQDLSGWNKCFFTLSPVLQLLLRLREVEVNRGGGDLKKSKLHKGSTSSWNSAPHSPKPLILYFDPWLLEWTESHKYRSPKQHMWMYNLWSQSHLNHAHLHSFISLSVSYIHLLCPLPSYQPVMQSCYHVSVIPCGRISSHSATPRGGGPACPDGVLYECLKWRFVLANSECYGTSHLLSMLCLSDNKCINMDKRNRNELTYVDGELTMQNTYVLHSDS